MNKVSKPFYVDYVRHCMRFYARTTFKPPFKTEVDEKNWYACHRAIEPYSSADKDIIIKVYAMRDTIADNVYQIATAYNLDQDEIWLMLDKFERKVAEHRGLVWT